MRRSPRIVAGDLVAVVSPSSTPTEEHLRSLIIELESWGLRVTLGEHVSGTHGPFAGRDADRLDDLNAAFGDPEVRAVFASRGGAGAYRIVDGIDFDAVRADPKPVIGFSDITNLHVSLLAETGLVTIHGCLGENQVAADVHSLLMGAEGLMISSDPTVLSAPIVVPGIASGRLVGGNLREFAGSVGAGLPDLAGTIVFLEDLRHVGIGQVDRCSAGSRSAMAAWMPKGGPISERWCSAPLPGSMPAPARSGSVPARSERKLSCFYGAVVHETTDVLGDQAGILDALTASSIGANGDRSAAVLGVEGRECLGQEGLQRCCLVVIEHVEHVVTPVGSCRSELAAQFVAVVGEDHLSRTAIGGARASLDEMHLLEGIDDFGG